MSQAAEARARRMRAFALVRRRHTREDASLTPEERLRFTDEMMKFWGAPQALDSARSTDEPMTLWRAMRARLRATP